MVQVEVCFPLLPALSFASVPPSRPCSVSTSRSSNQFDERDVETEHGLLLRACLGIH